MTPRGTGNLHGRRHRKCSALEEKEVGKAGALHGE